MPAQLPDQVILRSFKKTDSAALVRILNDAEVAKYLSPKIPSPYTQEDAEWWISEGSLTGLIRAIDYQGKLIGCVGITPGEFEYARNGEIGYWLDRSYWGKGIMAQAIEQLLMHAFTHTELVRVFGVVFDANQASMRLLQKCGFNQEAVLAKAIFKHGTYYDSHIFARLKN